MRAILALALLMVAAPALSATEADPTPRDAAVVEASVVTATPEAPAPILETVQAERRATASSPDAIAQDMPARGSFWWLVGVLVVAGIVLALVLD